MNRVSSQKKKFCPVARKDKLLFDRAAKGLEYLQTYVDSPQAGGGMANHVYYCDVCKGWHLTHLLPNGVAMPQVKNGVVIDGVLYYPHQRQVDVRTCDLCDTTIVQRCRRTGIMPCFAFSDNDDVFFKKIEKAIVLRPSRPDLSNKE